MSQHGQLVRLKRRARDGEPLSCTTGEAYSRLRAAEALAREGRRGEADAELARVLAFYRQAGAVAYIREAETLLAANPERAEDGHRDSAAR